jgi:hypothetical protein
MIGNLLLGCVAGIAFITIAFAINSIIETRKRYYDEYTKRKPAPQGLRKQIHQEIKALSSTVREDAAPAPVALPVALSERLPVEGDCDAEGRCWLLHVDKIGLLEWHFLDRYPSLDSYSYYGYTHWLPASAIPLPQVGEGEA